MNEEERLERNVQDLAATFRYPPTPDLAPTSRERAAPRGMAWAAALIVAVVALATAVPPVRAAFREILGIGSVEIVLGAPTPSTQPLDIDLPGETTLDAARAAAPVDVPLPTALGPPDRVFLLESVWNTVVLVWESEPAALYIIPAQPVVQKLSPETIAQAEVDGNPAIWTTGDHFLELVEGQPELTQFITGNVLVWEDGGVTYRLETQGPLEAALAIAESLR